MSPPPAASSPDPRDETARALQRQAAEWLALREARPLTAAEEADLAAWCAADPRHAATLMEVGTAYRTFDRLIFYPRPAGGAIDPDLLVRSRRRILAPALAACAAVAAIAAVVWWNAPANPAGPAPALAATSHFLRLPDGSKVELSSGAEVAEHFTAAERRVRLMSGEAHFEVAHNPQRPFIVEAGNVSVRAVGTAFDVRLRATTVAVLVTEGKVGVTTAGETPNPAPGSDPPRAANPPAGLGPGLILVAGERAEVHIAQLPGTSRPLIVRTLTQSQIDRALSWQSSRLVFEAVPLAEVVERFNRAAAAQDGPEAVHLQVRDADLGSMRISGRIRGDRIDDFVEVLQEDFGVAVERNGAEITLRRAR